MDGWKWLLSRRFAWRVSAGMVSVLEDTSRTLIATRVMAMGWGRHIKVQPLALREAAGLPGKLGESLDHERHFARGESDLASADNHGFQTSAALEGCLAAWEDNVGRLAGSITGVGDRLVQCANNYTGTDTTLAEVMSSMGGSGMVPAPEG